MQFSYVALNQKGVKQKGIIKANSEKEVLDFLEGNSLTPIRVVKSQGNPFDMLLPFRKVGSSDLVLFTRQLSSMITTGLTLLESLTTLKKQTTKAQMQQLLDDLIASISEGKNFSQALQNHDEVFPDVYISLVKAAETGGLLDKILTRLADNLERSEDLKKQVRSALFYPAIIIMGVIGVIVLMNVVVIPQLGKLYEGLNVELPLPTKIVLAMSSFFVNFWPFMLPSLVIIPLAYKRFQRTPAGKKVLDRVALRLPVFGSIIHLAILDESSRTLSLLISSGASIIEALTTTANVANNLEYEYAIKEATVLVESGIPLSNALEHQNLFPPVFIQMVRVGESTGKIDDSLLRLAGYFERDLNHKLKNLTTALEPIIIIILGGVIGFLIISVIMPIYGIVSKLQ